MLLWCLNGLEEKTQDLIKSLKITCSQTSQLLIHKNALLTPEQRKKAREFKMEERGFGHADERRDNNDKRPTRLKQQNRPLESRNM